jgi:hypothetical protein
MRTYWLQLTAADGDTWIDGIDAHSEDEAIRLAHWNWEGVAHVEVLEEAP